MAHFPATTVTHGLLAPADKAKLDGITAPTGSFATIPGYVKNAKLTYVSPSSITIGTGGLISTLNNHDDSKQISFSDTVTVDLSLTGAGGLDTGAEAADSWYAALVIGDSSSVNLAKGMFTASPDSPTLPAGYDLYRRAGWVRNNASSNLLKFGHHGSGGSKHMGYWEDRGNLRVLINGNSTTFAAVSTATLVPPGARRVTTVADYDPKNPNRAARIREFGNPSTSPVIRLQNSASSLNSTAPFTLHVGPAQRFEYSVESPQDKFTVMISGYTDDL